MFVQSNELPHKRNGGNNQFYDWWETLLVPDACLMFLKKWIKGDTYSQKNTSTVSSNYKYDNYVSCVMNTVFGPCDFSSLATHQVCPTTDHICVLSVVSCQSDVHHSSSRVRAVFEVSVIRDWEWLQGVLWVSFWLVWSCDLLNCRSLHLHVQSPSFGLQYVYGITHIYDYR